MQAGVAADNVRDKLKGLNQHESECGARTAECDVCGRAIMLKEMDIHRAAAHGEGPDLLVARPGTLAQAVAPANGPVSRPEAPIANDRSETRPSSQTVECPICVVKFQGADREQQLNAHLDNAHFSTTAAAMDVDDDLPPAAPPAISAHSSLRSLTVSCPICGMAVHSERDLSQHIDLVH